MNLDVNFQLQDIICIAPALFLFLGSLLPLTAKLLNGNREPNSLATLCYALFGIIASMATSATLYSGQKTAYYAFSNSIVFDGVSALVGVIIALITAIVAIMAREHVAIRGGQFSEFLFLLLNSAFGMLLFAWSNDLIMMFISIEVMSLCLYLMIALSHEEKLSKEAALKYFILGSFASAIFLYGVAFVYGVAGTTYINEVYKLAPQLISQNHLFLIGILLIVVGFGFKAAIAPFHAWTPDVYQGSPTPITAYMATGVKLVTFVAFLRFVRGDYLTQDMYGHFATILQWLAVITMFVGNLAAIAQNNLKRMLAYSSIAHSGYILMGLLAAAVGGEVWRGDLAVMYYAVAYAVMTMGAFAIVCLFEKSETDIVMIDDIKGLAKSSPFAAATFTLFLLSLAGIPPLVGFFGKFFLFSAVIQQGFYWLAAWAAINSVISAYYYLRPIVYMYMSEEVAIEIAPNTKFTQGVVVVMAALVVILGLATEPFYQEIVRAISTLL